MEVNLHFFAIKGEQYSPGFDEYMMTYAAENPDFIQVSSTMLVDIRSYCSQNKILYTRDMTLATTAEE